jgi:hypothetical protein
MPMRLSAHSFLFHFACTERFRHKGLGFRQKLVDVWRADA